MKNQCLISGFLGCNLRFKESIGRSTQCHEASASTVVQMIAMLKPLIKLIYSRSARPLFAAQERHKCIRHMTNLQTVQISESQASMRRRTESRHKARQ